MKRLGWSVTTVAKSSVRARIGGNMDLDSGEVRRIPSEFGRAVLAFISIRKRRQKNCNEKSGTNEQDANRIQHGEAVSELCCYIPRKNSDRPIEMP